MLEFYEAHSLRSGSKGPIAFLYPDGKAPFVVCEELHGRVHKGRRIACRTSLEGHIEQRASISTLASREKPSLPLSESASTMPSKMAYSFSEVRLWIVHDQLAQASGDYGAWLRGPDLPRITLTGFKKSVEADEQWPDAAGSARNLKPRSP